MHFLWLLTLQLTTLMSPSHAQSGRACFDLWKKPPVLYDRRNEFLTTASSRITDLAVRDQFLHQQHEFLRREGLLVEHGGLCTYLSALYAIHGLHVHHGFDATGFENSSGAQKVKGLLRVASDFYNHDGRYGSNLDIIAGVINKNIAQGPTGLKLNAIHRQFQIRESELMPDRDYVHLVVVYFGIERHTLVVLGIDIANQTITYLDPHNPSFPRTVPYRSGRTRYGEGVIIDYSAEHGHGQIIELLRMRALP